MPWLLGHHPQVDEFQFNYTTLDKPHVQNDTVTLHKRYAQVRVHVCVSGGVRGVGCGRAWGTRWHLCRDGQSWQLAPHLPL